jgi:hypothetical protein
MDGAEAVQHLAGETLWVPHGEWKDTEYGEAPAARDVGERAVPDVRKRDLAPFGLAVAGDGREERSVQNGLRGYLVSL